jgi:catechol 2,3-dioxygenase-like lactoylglutathione lyase family enzyme
VKRTWTIIGVADVARSFRWYQSLLGLLLFLRVDDFEAALPRARALVPRLEEEPHVNSSTGTQEFSLRDPDGYYVTISSLSAD